MTDINVGFRPDFFADSVVNSILLSSEQKIYIIKKDKDGASIYDTFLQDFNAYLEKMTSNEVKNSCRSLMNKDLLFLGIAKTKPDNVVVRLFITKDDKLAGLALDSQQLGVDPTTGATNSIDECVYATYFGLTRAAVIINKDKIRQNKDLHKLLSTYLYIIFLKAIKSDTLYSEKQKNLLQLLTIYIYYRHYLKEKHDYTLSIINREYNKIINEDNIDEFTPILDKMKSYSSIKDFPKMLVDAHISHDPPNVFLISLLKLLKPMGFYALTGPLDYFIPLVVITKYPVSFIGGKIPTNEKIQNTIEKLMIEYVDKIKYDLTAVRKI
jgi:hypothetical protein